MRHNEVRLSCGRVAAPGGRNPWNEHTCAPPGAPLPAAGSSKRVLGCTPTEPRRQPPTCRTARTAGKGGRMLRRVAQPSRTGAGARDTGWKAWRLEPHRAPQRSTDAAGRDARQLGAPQTGAPAGQRRGAVVGWTDAPASRLGRRERPTPEEPELTPQSGPPPPKRLQLCGAAQRPALQPRRRERVALFCADPACAFVGCKRLLGCAE